MLPSRTLRVIDANLDRAREGLRVLEDVARFILEDAPTASELRDVRHRLASLGDDLEPGLLGARQAELDVGATPGAPEDARGDLTGIVRANARRVEEALRVLEEFSLLPEVPKGLDHTVLKEARFELYGIEQRLTGRLLRQDKLARLSGLYVIVGPAPGAHGPELEVASEALEGGASTIQLRDKVHEKGVQLNIARGLRELCDRYGALLIINNDPDLALAVHADGVHLGQRDLPIEVARAIMTPDSIVGISAATVDEARQADVDGADYIAVGSIFETDTKEDTRPAGLETLQRVRQSTRRPLVAIGGIKAENVGRVVAAGADAVAVISAVVNAPDPRAAARELLGRMREQTP